MESRREGTRPGRALGASVLRASILRASGLALGALALAACGADAEPEGAGDADATGMSLAAESARGTFEIVLRPDGGAFPLNEPFAVDLEITDAEGGPLAADDVVTIDARMPAHGHGMLRDVALERVGPTEYRAEGMLLHMIGHWEVHVDVTRGPRVERAQASVQLEP